MAAAAPGIGQTMFETEREEAIYELGRDMVLAHEALFREQHQNTTPEFHEEIITDWHSDEPLVGTMAFRGGAKSTRSEEAVTLETLFRGARNVVILGESETRAVERLRAIKNNLLMNDRIQELFAIAPGEIWTETKALLSNGVYLQAYGRGQSLRGVKHLDQRPDLILIDDLEDEEAVATPEARMKTLLYFTKVVLPCMAPNGKIRIVGTPLHPESLIQKLFSTPGWLFKRYPIYFTNEDGELEATWPQRYSVEWAMEKRQQLEDLGRGDDFVQEYLCQPTNPATQTFTPEMMRVVPQLRSWHAAYAMYDPARTTNKNSATTGKVVWSWIGAKLVVWDGFAKKIMPDEIIKDMFEVDDEYNPVAIGVEETGLNEWLLQPIRTAQRERGHTLPLRPLNAPKGKLDFIRALQPYFRAGEVEFARDLPDLRAQLLGFPTGAIDFPNALAYVLKIRLGLPIYEGFGAENITPDVMPARRSPLWLALNSNGTCTTGVLCQIAGGQFSVLADWLVEGPPGLVLNDIISEAALCVPTLGNRSGKNPNVSVTTRPDVKAIAPKLHWDRNSIGLIAAAKSIPITLSRGNERATGIEEIHKLLRSAVHGMPAFRVDSHATWTLRALSGGYCRQHDKTDADPMNPYTVLVEGLEALAGMLRGIAQPSDNDRTFGYTDSGKKYLSALAR